MITGLARRERNRAHRPPVERAQKADELRAPGVVARQLDGSFHAFRTGIGHKGDSVVQKWGDLIQLFTQLDPLGVVEIRGDMDKFFRLCLDGFDHIRVTVPGCHDRNSSGEIQKAIGIHIPHFSSTPMIHYKWISTRV